MTETSGSRASNPESPEDEGVDKKKGHVGIKERIKSDWVEILAAVLLAFAAIATAWSGYQSARWSGLMTIDFSAANASRTEASIESDVAVQEISYDATIFSDAMDAYYRGRQDELLYIRENLLRVEFKTAVDAWLATDPANNPNAPKTPFDMPEYTNEHLEKSIELQNEAQEKVESAKENNQNSDNYVLLTVIFASVLFFAGISTKFKGERIRIMTVLFGYAVFIYGFVRVLQYPVH